MEHTKDQIKMHEKARKQVNLGMCLKIKSSCGFVKIHEK